VLPRRGVARADYDLVIASQPYRARASAEFKASKVLAPARSEPGPGGRMIAIHSHGRDRVGSCSALAGRKSVPDRSPRASEGDPRRTRADGRDLNFNAYADNRSIFRYEMHTLPRKSATRSAPRPLLAAWNAAVYVAQIEDQRLAEVHGDRGYSRPRRRCCAATGAVVLDESYVISRKRD